MVKGVNKTVIEVNDTGSRLFEKIVFYVTPEYGNLNAKQLRKAASAFSFDFEDVRKKRSLRKIVKRKRFMKVLGCCLLGIAAVTTLLIFIL